MAVDPTQMSGMAPPQGLSNTQTMAPPQVPQQPVPAGALQQPQQQPMVPGQPQQQPPPPKQPSLIPYEIKKALATHLNVRKMEVATAAAQFLGEPQGTAHVGIVESLRVWRSCNKLIDPLYEKIVNKKSDEDIMNLMYPLRMPYIRYTRRTYTEQVEFAEHMMELNNDPKYADIQGYDLEANSSAPEADFPSRDVQRKRIHAKISESNRPEVIDNVI